MPPNYTVDSDPIVIGGYAHILLSGTTKGMKARLGYIGGAVLKETKRRINGTGTTDVTIPQGFLWCHAGMNAYSGLIDDEKLYSVVIIDLGKWDTVELIRAILNPG